MNKPQKSVLSRVSAVVVTGGSSGIGKSLIKAICKIDQNIFYCNLSRTEPKDLPPDLRWRHFPCDLSEPEQISATAPAVRAEIEENGGSGEVLLINNSGFGSYGPFPEPDLDHQLGIMEVNMKAVVHLTGLMLPLLKERGGIIMNIASTASFQPTPYLTTYGATKAFLLNWSLALHEDLEGTGVRTLVVCPGPTTTNFFKRAGFATSPTDAHLKQTSEEVAAISLKALEKGKTLVVCGWRNRIMATLGSLLPKKFSAPVAGFFLRRARWDKFLEK